MRNSEIVSNFKERFNELFNESKKTTMELAKELHVSNQTISAWKTGTRSPKEPTMTAIANYFGVDYAWLAGYDVQKEAKKIPPKKPSTENEVPSPKSYEARIISGGIDKMPPERREQALKIFQIAFSEFADYFKEEDDNET